MALTLAAADTTEPKWPVNREIDLSSGFGDFRDGHFHSGIDLRTGGKIGEPVVAPVDGYVRRIRTSYTGYGKVIYFKGDDGYIYVFGHLSRFADRLATRVQQEQLTAERYYVDLTFEPSEYRYKRGSRLALSGQSGAGAPHLHFEKRTDQSNIPLNPLTHGFPLADGVPPTFVRVGFQLADDHSLLANGRRRMFLPVTGNAEAGYEVDTLMPFRSQFGLLVETYDQARPGGMKQAVHDLRLYLDDRLVYRSTYDSLPYETTRAVRLEYDYAEAAEGRKRTRRLYHTAGNDYGGSTRSSGAGIVGREGLAYGRHLLKVEASDIAGNISTLSVPILWLPEDDLYRLDSTIKVESGVHDFFLSPTPTLSRLGIDSTLALLNRRGMWGEPSDVDLRKLEGGRLQCRVYSSRVSKALLRLFVFVDGTSIPDLIFNGLKDSAPDRCDVAAEVLDDGLLVTVGARVIYGAKGHIRLYYRDSLLGYEPLQFFDMTRHACFIPPQEKYARIDRIGVTMTTDTTVPMYVFSDSLDIFLVGNQGRQTIDYDGFLNLDLRANDFFAPRFIEVRSSHPRHPRLRLNSPHYQIFPEAFAVRESFDIRLRVTNLKVNDWSSGVCWLDKKNNRWVWLDNELVVDTLVSGTNGGGSFAAVFDTDAPDVSRLSIFEGQVIRDRLPRISFLVSDTLSGIGDDRDIVVRVDGNWLIPEYDPESEKCQTQVLEPLEKGSHRLELFVTDRAGNRTELYRKFVVR